MTSWDLFSQSLQLTLLHSFWQSAILFALYWTVTRIFPVQHPYVKRGSLLFILTAQVVLSITVFWGSFSQENYLSSAGGWNQLMYTVPADQLTLTIYWTLTGLYATVLCVRIIRMIISWSSFRKNIRHELSKVPVELRLFTRAKTMELGIRRQVSIWLSSHVTTPMTFGFLKPVILLPVSLMNHISLAEAEALILHELSHIRRHDYIVNWFILFIEHIYFFNPFTRSLIRKFRLEREMSCDKQVLDYSYPAVVYAEALLKSAQLANKRPEFHLPAASGHQELVRRISYFTSPVADTNKENGKIRSLLFYLGACLLIVFASIPFAARKNNNAESYTRKPIQVTLPLTSETPYNSNAKERPVANGVMIIEDAPIQTSSTASHKKTRPSRKKSSPETNLAMSPNTPGEIIEPGNIMTDHGFHALNVAAQEPVASKDFVVREEDPASGMTVTKAYRMYVENGQWKTKFLWMTTETRPIADSLRNVCDSVQISLQ